MITARINPFGLKALCLAMMAAFPTLAEAGVAGRVQFVAGDVRIVDSQGREQAARKGQDVNEGDTLLSAPGGSAQLKMIDGAVVAVRPGTQLKVVGYTFSGKEDGSENASFSLVKGGLRAITGLIGKTNKDRYKIETPTVVIGIRGTDHEPVVVLPTVAGEIAKNPAGTYDKVNVGATSLTTQAGTTVVAANQVGFSASLTQLPVILPKMPDFYRATPAPQAKQAQKQEQKQEAKQEQKQEQQQEQTQTQEQTSAPQGGTTDSARSDAPAAATGVTNVVSAVNLTATDAGGNTLNLSDQTITTASGQSLNLNPGTSTTLTQVPKDRTELIAVYPSLTSPDGVAQQTTEIFYHPAVYFFHGPSEAVARDTAGNLTGVADTNAFLQSLGFRSSLSQSGSTLTDLGQDTATGLSWGRWQGGQVTQSHQYPGMDANGNWGIGADNAAGAFVIGGTDTNSATLGAGSLHWIAGKHATPDYLPQVLTGTANYTLVGGTQPTDVLGNTGTLTSATLGVNFTSQTAKANVNFAIGGNNWGMKSGAMPLDDGHFTSFDLCTSSPCVSGVSVTKNGAAVSDTGTPAGGFAFGSMNGSLMGLGLNSAGLQYAVVESIPTSSVDSVTGQIITTFSHNLITGAAGFSGPAQDVNTPFRIVGVADGWGESSDFLSLDKAVSSNVDGIFRGSVDGDAAPAARVIDGAGGLTEFIGTARGYTALNATTMDPNFSNRDMPATIKIGTAVNRDLGSATIDGKTVSWGRWEGGSVDIYSRDGTVKLGTIDNSGRSIHWLTSSVLTGPFSQLPLTGRATYTLAGNTSPTDFLGNAGKLGTATLTADFTNAKVNAGVSVSFDAPSNTSTWTMTANNIPLRGDGEFKSNTMLNGVGGIVHATSCTGTPCGPQTIGHMDGHFFGTAQGAVIRYGMTSGTTATTTNASAASFTPVNSVSGLVIMKR